MRAEHDAGLTAYLAAAAAAQSDAHQTDRDRLAVANLLLVPAVAKGYARDVDDLQDLIQEGNIGLLRAAESFEAERAAFSTWAALHIKSAIRNYLSRQDALSRYGRHGAERPAPVPVDAHPEAATWPAADVPPEANAWLIADCKRLQQCQRDLLRLTLAGFTNGEIAAAAGITRQAVEQRYKKAVDSVQQLP